MVTMKESMAISPGYRKPVPPWQRLFAIFMFSLAGIPPLFGFYGKLVVFNAAIAAGLFPLAVIGIAASVIGAFYYLKVVKTMYFDDGDDDMIVEADDKALGWIGGALALAVSPLGLSGHTIPVCCDIAGGKRCSDHLFEQVALTGSTNADLLAVLRNLHPKDCGCVPMRRAADGGVGAATGSANRAISTPAPSSDCRPTDPASSTLAFVAGLAAHETLRQIAPEFAIQLKWPNDVLTGEWRETVRHLAREGGRRDHCRFRNQSGTPPGTYRTPRQSDLRSLGANPPEPQAVTEILADQFASLAAKMAAAAVGQCVACMGSSRASQGHGRCGHLPDGEQD
jgi:hypothetical protein